MSCFLSTIRCAPVLLGAVVAWFAPLAAQAPAGTVTIPRVDQPPKLEAFSGEDPPDAAVRVTDFRQRDPGDGVPASAPTTAYLGYDDANLYVVFVCSDDPAKVRANVARRESISDDDQVVVYLDTFRDRKRAYFFAANPLGVQEDGILTEGQDEDKSFDAVWSSDGMLTANNVSGSATGAGSIAINSNGILSVGNGSGAGAVSGAASKWWSSPVAFRRS